MADRHDAVADGLSDDAPGGASSVLGAMSRPQGFQQVVHILEHLQVLRVKAVALQTLAPVNQAVLRAGLTADDVDPSGNFGGHHKMFGRKVRCADIPQGCSRQWRPGSMLQFSSACSVGAHGQD